MPASPVSRQLWSVLWAVVLAGGCAGLSPSPPGADVPVIHGLRVEPESLRAGDKAVLIFQFEDGDADVTEARLVERGVREFMFFQTLRPIHVNLGDYFGIAATTVRMPWSWPTAGIRTYDLFVVDKKGHVSNKLSITITVKPPAQ